MLMSVKGSLSFFLEGGGVVGEEALIHKLNGSLPVQIHSVAV